MDGSEQWVWYQSFGSAYRSSLRFDPEYWEHISTNPQQLFPLINKIHYWYFDEKDKIKLSIRRIENASCFPGSQVLLYAELLDLSVSGFSSHFCTELSTQWKGYVSFVFSAVLSQTHWWLFVCFLFPGIRSVMNKTEKLACISVIHVIRVKSCNIDFNKYLQPHTAC